MYRILTGVGSDVDRFYKNPTQENVERLARSVEQFENGSEAFKNAIRTIINNITEEENDVIDGREEEDGVAI